jgi:predicted lipoprotein with Yx(FWY)xxD motif
VEKFMSPDRSVETLAIRIVGAHIVAALLLAPLTSLGARASSDPRPKEVRIEMTDELGPVYADTRGRTLYTWKLDKDGESLCNGDKYDAGKGAGDLHYFLPESGERPTCQEVWPALAAKTGSQPAGRWSLVTRKDGSQQWAYDKKPVYTYAYDSKTGDVNGLDGGVVATRQPIVVPLQSPPSVTVQPTRLGRVLVTEEGKTLYVREDESAKKLLCTQDCEQTWMPFRAPAVNTEAAPIAGWSTLTRPDGSRQWAYQNQPLYTYVYDSRFSLSGATERNWNVVSVSKPLAPPAGITMQWTADGQVFADSEGRTLYLWFCSEDAPDRLGCDRPTSTLAYWRSICGPAEQCLATWKPALAPKNAKPIGRTWSIVTLDPTGERQFAAPDSKGIRVWAYRGRPLYTFARDREPGDMDGNNYMAFFQWGYRMLRAEEAYGLRNLQ